MPFLNRPDLRTNYQLLGPGLRKGQSPVALIHGLGANLAFWYLGAAPQLGRDRSLIMHDLRGHGASSMPPDGYGLSQLADDFHQLLNALGVERAHVVGHSHGARVALAFALAHPERVASLTLADTQLRSLQNPMCLRDWPHWGVWKAELAAQGVTSFPPDDAEIDFHVLAELGPRRRGGAIAALSPAMDGDPAAARRMDPGVGTVGGGQGGGFAARFMAARTQMAQRGQQAVPQIAPRGAAQDSARGLPEAGTTPTPGDDSQQSVRINLRSRQMGARSNRQWQTLLEQTTAAVDLSDESSLAPTEMSHLTMPALLMYGEMSHCVPTSERLLEIMPDARRILVPGAGHFFPLVKPRLFARALRMFVAGVETSGTPERHRFATRVMAARGARMQGRAIKP